MNKTARYSSIILIWVFLALIRADFALAQGCCYVEGGPVCDAYYEDGQAACEAQLGVYDSDPTCGGIPQCEQVCCCDGSIPHYTIRGECEVLQLNWIYTTEQGCNSYCGGVPECNGDCIANTGNTCIAESGPIYYPSTPFYYCSISDQPYGSEAQCNTACGIAPPTCSGAGHQCASANRCSGARYTSYDSSCGTGLYCCDQAATAYTDCCQVGESCPGSILSGTYPFCSGQPCNTICESVGLVGSVSGYVYNTTPDNRIANARVYAVLVSEPAVEVSTTYTDVNGNYLLNLEYGVYSIYAEKTGFETSYIQETITGDLTGRNINLMPYDTELCNSFNPPAPVITAGHVKGEELVSLTWTVECGNVNAFILKRDPAHSLGEIETDKSFFMDDNVSWGQSYKYSIKAHYTTGRESAWREVTITLGNKLCEGVYAGDEFCLDSTYGVGDVNIFRYTCNDNNVPVLVLDCSQSLGGGVCKGPDELGKTRCVYKPSDCRETSPFKPFGLYYLIGSCLNGGSNWCSYDYSLTTIDLCDDCDGKTCYDYRSKNACEVDNCGAGGIYVDKEDGTNQGCEWIFLWEEFGKGICYDPDFDEDKCSLCSADGGIFYNAGCTQDICSALGSCYSVLDSCLSCVKGGINKTKCIDFKSEESCTGGQENTIKGGVCGNAPIEIIPGDDACGLGVCKWNGAKCYKDADNNYIDDCAASPTPLDCNRDTEAPVTIPEPTIPMMNRYGYDIEFTSELDAVDFYYCVGGENCCPDRYKAFALDGSVMSLKINPVFYLGTYTKAGVYYIRYYSVDKNKNVEQVKTLPFYIDKDEPSVRLNYVSQKVGGNLNLQITLEADEYITCSYSMNPDPGTPTKNDFTSDNTARVFELQFQNIADTNYDLTTTCKDDVGNINIKIWNLFSPFNVTIYQAGERVDEIAFGDYTIRIETKNIFNTLNVDYSFTDSSDNLVSADVVMAKMSNFVWEGTFTISSSYRDVDDVFKIQIQGTDIDMNTHSITNTDYRINTIGPSITFVPADIGPDKVYSSDYPIRGYTQPDSTVYINVYECTSPLYCSIIPTGSFSGVSESDLGPQGIIDKQVEPCGPVWPGTGDTRICFNEDLTSTIGFDPRQPGAPTYYLEFGPSSYGIRYRIDNFEVSVLGGGRTYIDFSPGLLYPLSAVNKVSTYTSQYPSGWFDINAQLTGGLNLIDIYAVNEGRVGETYSHLVNYSTDGLNIVQVVPAFGEILYDTYLQSITLQVATDFAAICNISNTGNSVAEPFVYQMTPSNGGRLHSLTIDSSYCANNGGKFCYINNDGGMQTQYGVYHSYKVGCSPTEVLVPSGEGGICFGVRTWYRLGTTEYGVNICDGSLGCAGGFPDACEETGCVPFCGGRVCGDDGCGGSCGACGGGETCFDGACIPCQQNCDGLECGPDPVCGASCGACGMGEACQSGVCVPAVGGPGGEHD